MRLDPDFFAVNGAGWLGTTHDYASRRNVAKKTILRLNHSAILSFFAIATRSLL
jgi:hypothetical protein